MDSLLEDLKNMNIWEFAVLFQQLNLKNLEDFEAIHKIKAHQGMVRAMVFSKLKSNFVLISCGNDKIIKIWSMQTFALIKALEGHKEQVYKILTFTDNGRQYLCSSSSDRTIKIWSLTNFKLVKTLIGHKSTPYSLIFINDKKILISGDWDGRMIFWNIKKGSMILNLQTNALEIWSLHYDERNKQIIVGSKTSDKLLLYDLYTKKQIQEFKLGGFTNQSFVKFIFDINSIKIHPDMNEFLVCSGSNNIAIINKNYELKEYYFLKGHTNQIRSFAFCKKLNCLITASCDRSLRVWKFGIDTESNKLEIKEEKKIESPHSDNLNCVIINDENNFMATCSWDGDILIYKF